jgi:hypothetical protein
MIGDPLYRSLQMRRSKNPGAALEGEIKSSAVGCKAFTSPGPTQCSKLKVYRPKTAPKEKRDKFEEFGLERPQTGFPAYKKLSQMDLALCWDLIPPTPGEEPRRPKHIDGSNGSRAPSVFTLVKRPEDGTPEPPTKENFKEGNEVSFH